MLKNSLFFIWLKAIFRQFFFNIADNIVVLLSSLAILSLFFYITSNFINQKLIVIDLSLSYKAKTFFCYLITLLNFLQAVFICSKEDVANFKAEKNNKNSADILYLNHGISLGRFALRQAASNYQLIVYKFLRSIFIVYGIFLSGYLIVYYLFDINSKWHDLFHLIFSFVSLIFSNVVFGSLLSKIKNNIIFYSYFKYLKNYKFIQRILVNFLILRLNNLLKVSKLFQENTLIVFNWKLRFLFIYTPYAKILLLVSIICSFSSFFISLWAEELQLILAVFLCATINCFVICYSESYWLKSSKYEKLCGMSHANYIKSLKLVSYCLSFIAFMCVFVSLILAWMFSSSLSDIFDINVNNNLNLFNIIMIFKFAVIAAIPCVLLPSFLLQIDGKKSAVNTILIFIISLFLATLIYVNILCVLLLPVIIIYADNYQLNRYYTT